jgi:hypothetical protein
MADVWKKAMDAFLDEKVSQLKARRLKKSPNEKERQTLKAELWNSLSDTGHQAFFRGAYDARNLSDTFGAESSFTRDAFKEQFVTALREKRKVCCCLD